MADIIYTYKNEVYANITNKMRLRLYILYTLSEGRYRRCDIIMAYGGPNI